MPKPTRQKRSDGLYKSSIVIGRKPDGKPIRKYIYAKTIKELEARTAEYEQQLRHGTLSADENARFAQVANAWIETSKATSTEKIKKRYQSIVNKHLHDLSSIKVKDLKPMHLQAIMNDMAQNGYAKKTMAEVKQTATSVLDFAIDNDIVFRNVFTKVSVPNVEAEERQPIPEGTRALVLRSWQGHRMGVPALIMLYCGLRRGELIALTWRDIDMKAKTISIIKATAFYGNKGSVKAPKSKSGVRTVPIPDAVMPALAAARATTSMMVCPAQKTGGMMSSTAFNRAWNSYQHYLNLRAGGRDRSRSNPKVIAVESFTAHQLRHTYATMLYDAGVDILTAQRLLGHSDVQTTMRIYTHLSEQKEQRSIDAFNTLVNAQNEAILALSE